MKRWSIHGMRDRRDRKGRFNLEWASAKEAMGWLPNLEQEELCDYSVLNINWAHHTKEVESVFRIPNLKPEELYGSLVLAKKNANGLLKDMELSPKLVWTEDPNKDNRFEFKKLERDGIFKWHCSNRPVEDIALSLCIPFKGYYYFFLEERDRT